MRINRLRLHNFSSFAGESMFDFTLEGESKNIILIGGKNGAGKTSLFTAMKLGLYGPLAFSYQGHNAAYTSRIKELLNHSAYVDKQAKAAIEIEIVLLEEREPVKYTLLREWTFANQGLTEEFTVERENVQLKGDELLFFQSFLHTVVPPNLFDLFFFDGEQVADFISSSNYNTYIKNAVLTLCSFDTFELIKRFSQNYSYGRDKSGKLSELEYKYREIADKLDNTKGHYLWAQEELENVRTKLGDIQVAQEELAQRFRSSGGLMADEREAIEAQLRETEREKGRLQAEIQNFVEKLMPFILTRDLALEVNEQLNHEEQIQQYNVIAQKLNPQNIGSALRDLAPKFNLELATSQDGFIEELTQTIADRLKPELRQDEYVVMHDLSQEQRNKVQFILEQVFGFSVDEMIDTVNRRIVATETTMELNRRLRDALSGVDLDRFLHEMNGLKEQEAECKSDMEKLENLLEQLESDVAALEKESDAAFQALKEEAQQENAFMLTQKLSSMMEELISMGTRDKAKEIADEMLVMFQRIIRKERFIDLVELDEKFRFNLFKEQTYSTTDLLHLIDNVGYDGLAHRVGNRGVERLLLTFGIDSLHDLRRSLRSTRDQLSLFDPVPKRSLGSYQRVELNQLSKGEKQILALCAYWAIIKASKQDIPFIIDTPYARIETEHREAISRVFFPTISSQVIVLSTDEEVTAPYYEVLKPFIAREYLLTYDETENRSIVDEGYFVGV